MHRRHHHLGSLVLLIGLGLGLTACSAILDTDSLNDKRDGAPPDWKLDGEPYPVGRLESPPAPTLPEQRLALTPTGDSLALDFRWEDLPGRPTRYDLSLGSSGQQYPMFQVFARHGQPYARWGLRVTPLRPDGQYRLRIDLKGERVKIALSCLHPRSATQVEEIPAPTWLKRARAVHLVQGKANHNRVIITALLHGENPLNRLARTLMAHPATEVALLRR